METAKSLVITGHRPPRLGGYHAQAIEKVNEFAVRAMAARRSDASRPAFDYVAIGMAQGWDMACARACLLLDIPYVAFIPHADYQIRWPMAMRRVFSYLVDHATNQVMVSDHPAPGYTRAAALALQRNTMMLEHGVSVLALCYDEAERGGTSDTIRKARARHIPVDNLWSTWEAFVMPAKRSYAHV